MIRLAALVLASMSAGITTAAAHPFDQVVQAAYLSIEPTRVRLELDVTPGPAVLGSVLRDLDPNGDGRVTPAEARSYAAALLRLLPLTSDGRSGSWRLDQVGVPAIGEMRGEGGIVRVFAVMDRQATAGRHLLALRDDYRPAAGPVMINVFPQNEPGWTCLVLGQTRNADGRSYRATLDIARATSRPPHERSAADASAGPGRKSH